MLIDLEELAGNIASKVDGARLTPVIEKEIVHYEIIRSLGRNDLLRDDGKERRVTVLALRKLVATQGDGRWLTKSLDETESAFKGRYQPKAWRGALPSLRLRDLSAGE